MLIEVKHTTFIDPHDHGHQPPPPPVKPFFIIKRLDRNWEFYTKDDIQKPNGRKHYFDLDLTKARQYDDFDDALNKARWFLNRQDGGSTRFYVCDFIQGAWISIKCFRNRVEFIRLVHKKEVDFLRNRN
jgi:hypothetical protein